MSSGLSEPAANLYMQVARHLPSTCPRIKMSGVHKTMDNVNIVGLVNVDVVDVIVDVLVHVGVVVQVVRCQQVNLANPETHR